MAVPVRKTSRMRERKMLPNLDDLYDDIKDEARRELVLALLEVFKDLKKQDINHTTLGDLFLLMGYDHDEIDAEDFEFDIDLTKGSEEMFTENYLDARMRDKLN